jgi:predicted amidohydrolase
MAPGSPDLMTFCFYPPGAALVSLAESRDQKNEILEWLQESPDLVTFCFYPTGSTLVFAKGQEIRRTKFLNGSRIS